MSIDDVRGDAATFVDKWRARWPEWEVAEVFVPDDQRRLAEAWFALVQELTDAAWAGADPTPGLAKLAWWQEELAGWAKGARRHPLGQVLQPRLAPWVELRRSLPALQAMRDTGTDDGVASPRTGQDDGAGTMGAPFAAALARCESVLFGGRPVDDAACGAVLRTLLGERALVRRAGDVTDAGATRPSTERVGHVDARRLPRAGSRPRGILAALVDRRLARPGAPLPPLRALFAAWRGARRAG